MAYTMVRNAKCEGGFKRTKWASLGRTQCSQGSNAIDELGRMFAWGQNNDAECGLGNFRYISYNNYERPDLLMIEYATQVGSDRNWVKSCSGEMSTVALNKDNELWGWGAAHGSGNCEAFGLPPDSGEGKQSWMGIPDPGKEYYFFTSVRVAPGYLFKEFAHDYYHTIAIGLDNRLYTWGYNDEYALGMNEDVVPYRYSWATPILNTYLTDDVKLLDCEAMCNIAVTVDDKVYVWGEGYYLWFGYDLTTPCEITGLTIPPGETIIEATSSPMGITILLSNGELWAAGIASIFGDAGVSYPGDSESLVKIPFFISKEVVKVKNTALGNNSIFAITSDGNIWGWSGDMSYFKGNSLAHTYNIFGLVASEFEGEHKYIDVVTNGHNQCYQAIDESGYLWTWGRQWWGPHLAIGAARNQTEADYNSNVTDVVLARYIAGLAAKALDYRGEFTTLNSMPLEESEYIQPLPQLLRHKPCGHWHLRLFEEEDLWPRNCWMPSVSLYQNHLMFVACGKHLQRGGDTGCEVMIFDYDIDANIWNLVSYTNLINAANAPGGASIYDDTMVFANWKADATGTDWYDEHYSNYGLGVWVLDGSYNLNYTHFDSKNEMYMQGKVAAYSGGIVAIAYEDNTGQLLIQVSIDYGATWNLRKTVGILAARNDYSLVIDKNGYIFLAHQISTNYVMTERSIDNGITWTTQNASNYILPNILNLKLVSDNDMLFLFTDSAIASAIERSSNSGVSWSTVSGEPFASSHVSSGCNISDNHDDIAFVTSGEDLNNYLYDLDYGGYNWLTRTIPQISDEGLEINTYQGPNNADLASYNGRFAYSAYGLYTIPVPYVAVALSVDNGQTWFVRGTPLGWNSVGEIGNFDGCPLFCLTDVPYLNHIWTFEKSNWAAEFVRQEDKYKHVISCKCPQYRGT